MAGILTELSDSSFEQEVTKALIPVVVDFWAPWCPPCKKIAPVLEEIAKEYSGKVEIKKVNVDEFPNLAAKFDIKGIPALIFFKNGEVVEKLVGAVPKSNITDTINAKLVE
jgi:thioredoxin 1